MRKRALQGASTAGSEGRVMLVGLPCLRIAASLPDDIGNPHPFESPAEIPHCHEGLFDFVILSWFSWGEQAPHWSQLAQRRGHLHG